MKYKLAEMKIFWATRPNPGGVLEELKTGSLVTTKNNCLNGFKITGKLTADRILFIGKSFLREELAVGLDSSPSKRTKQKQFCEVCRYYAGDTEPFCFVSEEYVFDKIKFIQLGQHGHDLLHAKHREEVENHSYTGVIYPLCCHKQPKQNLLFLGAVEHKKDFRLMVDKINYKNLMESSESNPKAYYEELALGKFLTPNKQLIYLHGEQIKKLEIVNAK